MTYLHSLKVRLFYIHTQYLSRNNHDFFMFLTKSRISDVREFHHFKTPSLETQRHDTSRRLQCLVNPEGFFKKKDQKSTKEPKI